METWIPILDGNYQISNLGSLKRLTLWYNANRISTGPKPWLSHNGYLRVTLFLRGTRLRFFLHNIVAENFLGPKPKGLTVNHKDGDKLNNTSANLEYVTHLENMRHASLNRLCASGELHGMAKLKTEDVLEIRRLAALGTKRSQLSEQFKIEISHIGELVRRESWAWL